MWARLLTSQRTLVCCELLITFFLAVSVSVAQKTYYVASTGNDANDGLAATSPIQSLSRVNSLVLQPGDAVLFRRGDTFRGTLQVSQSGVAEKPIYFDAYGSGNKPLLVGSVPVRNWTRLGANTWQSYCPACSDQVTGVYYNGLAQPLGRYPNPDAPNRGDLAIQSHVGTSQMTSQQTLTTDWTGAEVVLNPTYWIIDRATITQQHSNTLILNNPSTYSLTDNWGFFIQNHPATLDQYGEWYYNPATQVLQIYYDKGNPNDQFITATASDYVINSTNAAFVTIQNLHIAQARRANMYALNVGNLVLRNDDFTDSGEDGVIIQGSGNQILVENSTITNSNNNGIYIGAYQNVTFRKSTIRKIGLLPGRGKSGDGQFTAFQSFATHNTVIENNVIDGVGYIGISIQNNTTVRQNSISNFCMVKSDGGGIYLWNGANLPTDSIRIESNIIRKGIGTIGSLSETTFGGAHGIFLDDCVKGVDVIDNTILDCQGLGIYLHAVSNINLIRNTSFNNSVGQLILYNYDTPCLTRNNLLQQNVLIAGTASQPVVGYISGANDLANFGLKDHNFYARPFNDISTIRAVYNKTAVSDLSLSEWQSQFSQDLMSHPSSLTFKDYTIQSLASVNRIVSSSGSNSDGWDTWSLYNNGQATWSKGSQPAKGSLTVYFSNASGHADSYMLTYKGISAVAKSKSYLVRFGATASVNRKVVVFIRQRQAPYQDLTRRFEFMAGSTHKTYEFALTVLADNADALLTFQLGEATQPVLLDNISLQEATIAPANTSELVKLVYNSTTSDSLISLKDTYRDVKNHYYGHQVILKPFTSVVLLRDSLPPVDINLALKVERSSMRVGEVTSVSLTLHNTSANARTLASKVQWSCQFPTNLTPITGINLLYKDSLLTGIVQRLVVDTTFVFQVKAIAPGQYKLAAQVTETTYADPNSTPDSGTDDGEDDQFSITLVARSLAPGETVNPTVVTATEPLIEKKTIYPNPTLDEFIFEAEDDVTAIRLVDLLGRERLSLSKIQRGQTIRFGQPLPDAYYVLYIQYKTGEQRVVKLVKLGGQ